MSAVSSLVWRTAEVCGIAAAYSALELRRCAHLHLHLNAMNQPRPHRHTLQHARCPIAISASWYNVIHENRRRDRQRTSVLERSLALVGASRAPTRRLACDRKASKRGPGKRGTSLPATLHGISEVTRDNERDNDASQAAREGPVKRSWTHVMAIASPPEEHGCL